MFNFRILLPLFIVIDKNLCKTFAQQRDSKNKLQNPTKTNLTNSTDQQSLNIFIFFEGLQDPSDFSPRFWQKLGKGQRKDKNNNKK